jgi:hypothetical protein
MEGIVNSVIKHIRNEFESDAVHMKKQHRRTAAILSQFYMFKNELNDDPGFNHDQTNEVAALLTLAAWQAMQHDPVPHHAHTPGAHHDSESHHGSETHHGHAPHHGQEHHQK